MPGYLTVSPREFIEHYAALQEWSKRFVGRSSYDARFCVTLPCTCIKYMSVRVTNIDADQLIRLDADLEVLKKYAEEHPTDAVGIAQLIKVTPASFPDSFVNGSVLLFSELDRSVQRITCMSYYNDTSIRVHINSDVELIVDDDV